MKRILVLIFIILSVISISYSDSLKTLTGHLTVVTCVKFSPDGKYLLSGSGDGEIKLWDAATWKEVKTFSGGYGYILCAAFSPDGKYIAAGTANGIIKLWEVETQKEVKVFLGHSNGCVFFI